MAEKRLEEDVKAAFRQVRAFREVLEEIAYDACRCAPDWTCSRCLSRGVLKKFPAP